MLIERSPEYSTHGKVFVLRKPLTLADFGEEHINLLEAIPLTYRQSLPLFCPCLVVLFINQCSTRQSLRNRYFRSVLCHHLVIPYRGAQGSRRKPHLYS
jgi:hypothetical protein